MTNLSKKVYKWGLLDRCHYVMGRLLYLESWRELNHEILRCKTVVYLIKQLKFSSVTEINQAFKLYIQGVCILMYFIYYHATCRVNTDFYSLTDKPTNH
jgi:hypothetical protein